MTNQNKPTVEQAIVEYLQDDTIFNRFEGTVDYLETHGYSIGDCFDYLKSRDILTKFILLYRKLDSEGCRRTFNDIGEDVTDENVRTKRREAALHLILTGEVL